MTPMAALPGTAFHKIRRSLVIKASRRLRRVPGRSTIVEDIKGLRPLQSRKAGRIYSPSFPIP